MTDMSLVVRVKREGGRGHHLIARAKYDADPGAYVRVDEDGSPVQGDPDTAELREAYLDRFGKKPFMGWNAEQLREKLAAA